jgi:hypothetical protein
MTDRNPAVTKIHAHLEGEHNITYPHNATHEQRLIIAENSQSHLLQYFKRPSNDCFSTLTILDYYEQYIVTTPRKEAPLIEMVTKTLFPSENMITTFVAFPSKTHQ